MKRFKMDCEGFFEEAGHCRETSQCCAEAEFEFGGFRASEWI